MTNTTKCVIIGSLTLSIIIVSSLCFCSGSNTSSWSKRFPPDFKFGAGSSAYQVEGAWNVGGKGVSVWDHFTKTRPEKILDRTNGDSAAKSYYFYKRDVEMLKELGVDSYRFSISWSRVMPHGRGFVNPEGIAYYNNLIDEILANNIEPWVTIYHWDMPHEMNELCDWLNEDIVDWFGDYARELYKHFGDRVKHWLTINEPNYHCWLHRYVSEQNFEDYTENGFYECIRNAMLAHARAYHIYDDEFRSSQAGEIGLIVSTDWGVPRTNSEMDAQALEVYRAFFIDYFIHPVFSEIGNYPQLMIDKMASASAALGLNSSRLRPFLKKQVDYIKGSSDFLALNSYSGYVVAAKNRSEPSVNYDSLVERSWDPSWPQHGRIVEFAPGFHQLLVYIKKTYNNPRIYITENGCPSGTGLHDDGRVEYIRKLMQAVADAIADGVNVKGYFVWSLMDGFEWSWGYTTRFGLYEVDMDDDNRTRTARKSALVYKDIIRSRTINYGYDPDPHSLVKEQKPNEK